MKGALLFALVALVVAVALADQCTFTAGNFVLPSTLKSCFQQIPLSTTVKANTLAQLRNLASLYSFADVSKNSGSPFYIHANLEEDFDRIAARTFDYDFQFHEELRFAFARLGDAHTVYYAPTPYRSFAVLFPFRLGVHAGFPAVTITADQVVITPDGGPFPWIGDILQVNLTSFVGQQITHVDSIEVAFWLQFIGDSVGQSRSASTRFNNAILNGLRRAAIGVYVPMPERDYFNITFASGISIQVPIPIYCARAFSSISDFQSQISSSLTSEKVASEARIFGKSVVLDNGLTVPMAGVDVNRLLDAEVCVGPLLIVWSTCRSCAYVALV